MSSVKSLGSLPAKELVPGGIASAGALPKETIDCTVQPATLTVGEASTLKCSLAGKTRGGAIVASQTGFVNLDSNASYQIVFLDQPQVTPQEVTQKITSYKVGTHEFSHLKLSFGDQEFLVSHFALKVNSVLPAPKNAEEENGETGSGVAKGETVEPTPFPIFDPLKVGAPWWWWTMWALLLIVALGFIGYKLRQYLKARRKMSAAASEAKLLTPAEKFKSRLRKLESSGLHLKGDYKGFALELTVILKMALSDQLHFAAEDMTSEELISHLEKRSKTFFKQSGLSLVSILSGLDQIKFAKVETDAENCLSLIDKSMKVGAVLFEGQI